MIFPSHSLRNPVMDSRSPPGVLLVPILSCLLHEVCQVTRSQSLSLINSRIIPTTFGRYSIYPKTMNRPTSEEHLEMVRSRRNRREQNGTHPIVALQGSVVLRPRVTRRLLAPRWSKSLRIRAAGDPRLIPVHKARLLATVPDQPEVPVAQTTVTLP
jgi:hypothetical protein